VKMFSGTTTELAANVLAPQTLVTMVQSVDPAYYKTPYGTAKWYMSAAQAFNFASVVDSQGRPLLDFLNGLDTDNVQSADYNSNSAVGSLLGFEVVIDNSIGALTASTTSGPVFANLGHAMVKRQVNTASVLRLDQRYAELLAVGYIGFLRLDIRSNDLRAAVTVTAAAT
jgi:HK97 family phage major capsid protein